MNEATNCYHLLCAAISACEKFKPWHPAIDLLVDMRCVPLTSNVISRDAAIIVRFEFTKVIKPCVRVKYPPTGFAQVSVGI